MRRLGAIPIRKAVPVICGVVIAGMIGCGAHADTSSHWMVDFDGVRGVRPGMTRAGVVQRWHVTLKLTNGSAPRCVIGSFRSGGVAGGALFQDGRFDAAWFEAGVTTRGGIEVGSTFSKLRREYGRRLKRQRNIYDPTRPLYYVRGGPGSSAFLEFVLGRSSQIERIGFGDRFVLVQEGCN